MATLAKTSPLAALMTLALLVPATARAQDQRFRASFAPAAAAISGDAELALGGTFGYRASKHCGSRAISPGSMPRPAVFAIAT